MTFETLQCYFSLLYACVHMYSLHKLLCMSDGKLNGTGIFAIRARSFKVNLPESWDPLYLHHNEPSADRKDDKKHDLCVYVCVCVLG